MGDHQVQYEFATGQCFCVQKILIYLEEAHPAYLTGQSLIHTQAEPNSFVYVVRQSKPMQS